MKKIIKNIGFASLMAMASIGSASAETNEGLCALIEKMHDVFVILRTLAFVGAAFIIAGWAWGYISNGKAELKDVKDKGIGMLIGFVLLFGIGIALTFFANGETFGCAKVLTDW